MATPQCQFKTTGGVREKNGRWEYWMVNSQILRFCQRYVFLTSLRNARAIEFYFVQLDWMSECNAIAIVI